MAAAKQPALQFSTGDWLKDPKLSMCSPAARGIWLDVICAMHELGRSGVLTGTPTQLVRLLRCTETELLSAITELSTTGTADVTERNGVVTLVCRRMKRETKARTEAASRQTKHRESRNSNADITPPSQPSSSSSSSSEEKPKKVSKREGAPPAFIVILLKGGNLHPVEVSEIEEWEKLYPDLDIRQELRNMKGWLVSDLLRLKTKRGINRFIHGWFRKAIQIQNDSFNGHNPTMDAERDVGANTYPMTDEEEERLYVAQMKAREQRKREVGKA